MLRRSKPIHPGEILNEEFLKPLGITKYKLAKDIHVPPQRVGDIVNEKRAISTDTALRLSCYFKTSKEFWLGLQMQYDIEVTEDLIAKAIEKEIIPYDKAA